MSEEEEKTEIKPEDTPKTDSVGEGDKYKATPLIERAREERERMEAVAKTLKEENDRLEKLRAEQMLSSTAGGHVEPQKSPEESPGDYMKKVMAGEGKYGTEED